MRSLKRIFVLFGAFAISTNNLVAQHNLQTKRYLKSLDKAIEKNFQNHSELIHNKSQLKNAPKRMILLEIKNTTTGNIVGWAGLAQAKGRQDYFDFLVLYDSQLELKHLEILQYRSSHGYQINSGRWLEHFTGLAAQDTIIKGRQVDGISGATMSVDGLIEKINEMGSFMHNRALEY